MEEWSNKFPTALQLELSPGSVGLWGKPVLVLKAFVLNKREVLPPNGRSARSFK